ncbi:alpha/beta hydrolase fold domain-containing protein [Auraticoccus sp. F435]|uniref:Alpha/beta hydrolase fold domain-containing protein n=1 Tax=Auraticoccus cholistanensis TaxID=2656650 RepID=A0A6A9UQS4_9ACTN|nr:alpha/beta hydrolase [Auraticoccus cholistanensis]MVA75093.1 alpha/beta hydrolase fold domain-containing protein [Auraticoccus cholistanensis]
MPRRPRQPAGHAWQDGLGRVVLGAGAVAGGLALAGLTGAAALRLATPGPVAWTVRRLTRGGRSEHPDVPELAARVVVERDRRVPVPGAPDVRYDLYRPASGGSNPTLVWWHGGGFVGGDRAAGYDFGVLVASHGFTVVQPSVALAPDAGYPAQLRQGRALLAALVGQAAELGIDPGVLVLGGESSGATLAAQLVGLHTDPELAGLVGLEPVVPASQLRALVLYCGILDLFTVADTGFPLIDQMLWAYLGRRDWRRSPVLRQASPLAWVNGDWPQTFLSVGDGDPLRPQSVALADRLEEAGVPVTRSFHEDSRMNLQHGFQFAYRTVDGRAELDRTLAFLERAVRR